jgi:uncharacterized membrane protein (DUF485 family)
VPSLEKDAMGDLGHKNLTEVEDPLLVARRAQVALRLFAVYCALYAGFMWLNAFRPQWMEWRPALGVNLAIWYGMALIVGALVLALVYAVLCRRLEGRS